MCGVVLWAINPSVANAIKVAATVVSSVSVESSPAVFADTGTTVNVTRPTATSETAITYQVLRESV